MTCLHVAASWSIPPSPPSFLRLQQHFTFFRRVGCRSVGAVTLAEAFFSPGGCHDALVAEALPEPEAGRARRRVGLPRHEGRSVGAIGGARRSSGSRTPGAGRTCTIVLFGRAVCCLVVHEGTTRNGFLRPVRVRPVSLHVCRADGFLLRRGRSSFRVSSLARRPPD